MKILVTGGAGYIGSQTCLELLRIGHNVLVIDNLCNSSAIAMERVTSLSGRNLTFVKGDIRNFDLLNMVFAEFKPDAVIHFAGLKAVSESVSNPLHYYDVNVGGTIALLKAMARVSCNNIVFSSSATVYGEPQYLPCDEMHPVNPINPYGRTKLIGENLIEDWCCVKDSRRAVSLRYFNPVGADTSGEIGEDPNGTPNNLMPFIAQVAVGRRKLLRIFGRDYDTMDGTGVRDYVHVIDLARAHVLAVEKIRELGSFEVINIGTGKGLTVLQMVREFERQSCKKIQIEFGSRRSGDAAEVWANPSKAKQKLGFQAEFGAASMCADTWRWQSANPDGYFNKET